MESCSITLATQSLRCHCKLHAHCSLPSSTEQVLGWQLGLSVLINRLKLDLFCSAAPSFNYNINRQIKVQTISSTKAFRKT